VIRTLCIWIVLSVECLGHIVHCLTQTSVLTSVAVGASEITAVVTDGRNVPVFCGNQPLLPVAADRLRPIILAIKRHLFHCGRVSRLP